MIPVPHRVANRVTETHDAVTVCLEPVRDALPRSRPGQFMMLYAHGVGEVAISVSGDPSTSDGTTTHTIRAVGAVSRALHDTPPGAVLGVRGPFGTGWDLASVRGRDLVVVAGGLGLAPLRPVVLAALADRASYRHVVLVAGARTPREFLYRHQLNAWAWHEDIDVCRTVDVPGPGWAGGVGFVTEPLAALDLEPAGTTALLCGPEPMMRFCARTLQGRGVAARDIQVSLERNMKCGAGQCGHCQLGPLLVCRDGPVVTYDVAGPLLKVREL
ncbi:NAD(P)H-flavin reductase [Amycolatopsis sacchari]|uniref:NAD(P)H-flavin reductase n=2 Tax=Amycolatopsis TaxID=1813 RepID=A0A1I3KVM8_9PSEU|nr:NAD(P)H-flavin reductase [Amycolatopsis sacchari]